VFDAHTLATLRVQGADPHALQPNSLQCFGCGLENAAGLRLRFFNDGPGRTFGQTMLHDMHQGYPGVAHGGVVATMLDEAMSRAPLSGDFARLVYTAKMEVRYRKVVPIHQTLTLQGWIEKDRGRIIIAAARLLLPDESIAAEVTGTLCAIPQEELAQMNTPEVGWQVYPLEQVEEA
jgi:acyl-coenzyme A thioesterase PaaI-like protein